MDIEESDDEKPLSLDKQIGEMLTEGDVGKAKWFMENLREASDFLIALTILSGRDKKNDETIEFYDSLFWGFKSQSRLIDLSKNYITKKEWHNWTEVLIEMSNVLWKWRDRFEPNMWLETNAKIYEVAFRNFKDDEKYSQNGLCFMCSRLFTEVLFNFASHAREGDKSGDFHISSEKVREISKMIGTRWEAVTHANIIEEKISKHSL